MAIKDIEIEGIIIGTVHTGTEYHPENTKIINVNFRNPDYKIEKTYVDSNGAYIQIIQKEK